VNNSESSSGWRSTIISPSTDEKRLNTILNNASGFLYYITITGITGQNSADVDHLNKSVNIIKSHTKLPIVAGFGIKNRKDVEQISSFTDGVVVGSSIINIIKTNLDEKNKMINKIWHLLHAFNKSKKYLKFFFNFK
jgi:tryptophan synthase alpha chain